MIGTIVNSLAIIAGSLLGLFLKSGISERYREILMHGVSMAVILVGLKSALVANQLLVVILCLVSGGVAGEFLQIEQHFENLGRFLEDKLAAHTGNTTSFAKGFVTASLVYCVGSMAIVGSLESGLTGNHQTLFAKSILDGVISIVFASTMGIGVLFSSVAVFIYQGTITLFAFSMKAVLVPETIAQMTSVGGLLIMAIGLNSLKITSIRVGNFIPGIFLPLLWYLLQRLL